MPTLVYINPLKPGKLEAYKAFCKENTSIGKEKYIEMLKRYGLKNAKAWHHELNGTQFVVVYHDAEENARELLADFMTSSHPYDQWFVEQLKDLHDFEEAGEAKHILNFIVNK